MADDPPEVTANRKAREADPIPEPPAITDWQSYKEAMAFHTTHNLTWQLEYIVKPGIQLEQQKKQQQKVK